MPSPLELSSTCTTDLLLGAAQPVAHANNSTAITSLIDAALVLAYYNSSNITDVFNPTLGDPDYSGLASAYCAGAYSGPCISPVCLGICPNPDVSGIGVRSSFYFNSVANALLVAVSPSDAAAGAWSSTILTAALIGPALLQKAGQSMTLHHAYIVAALGTLSAVSSLATAPMVPIWRGGKQATRLDEVDYTMDTAESEHGRVVLAFALIIQIVLVWAWVIFLFVNPYYSQDACSGATVLVWLGGKHQATYIDENLYWAWALWLLCYAAVTAGFGVVLVYSSQSPVHDIPETTREVISSSDRAASRSSWLGIWWATRPFLLPHPDDEHYRVRLCIGVSKFLAAVIVVAYALIAEAQIKSNYNMILPGEDQLSFSQVAAIMLSAAPLWPLAMAYKEKWSGRSASRGRRASNATSPSPHTTPQGGSYSPIPLASPTLSPTMNHSRSRRRSNSGSDVFVSTPGGSEGDGESLPLMPRPRTYEIPPVDFPNFPFPLPEGSGNRAMPLLVVTGPGDEEDIVPSEDSHLEPGSGIQRALPVSQTRQRRGHQSSPSDGVPELVES
ncbi:hypothetical protein FRB96_000275 [Tulasnella sp. 330]|nr:hypothetical protein FRB96_000275 [Tulasnella sp. 330]KAG8882253.1 hypothetical protein FRB97_008456 [Tulasnella sp. 331]KAG8886885.1 hypothetical protein FRB98_000911 [Tulasnella sp. 332]